MKILAIGAHPDDLEMQCSGTLALYSKQGHDVFMCHVCSGDKGSLVYNSDELTKIRRNEAIEAAGLIGAESIWGGMKDCEVVLDLPARLKMVDVFRQVNPDLVITHHPNDYQVDHVNVSRLVFDAILIANVKLLESNYPSTDKTPVLYYMDTVAGVNFDPSEYVNISSTMEIKIEMMLTHKSQLGWIEKMYGIHTEEFLKTIARFRGLQAGVPYAETFVQKKIFSTGLTSRILP
jgi:N-acetylglucosamine malate deacetylase 1